MKTPVLKVASTAAIPTSKTPVTPTLGRTTENSHSWWRGGIEFGAASVRGSYHEENEDSFIPVLPSPSQLAVADGVGGGAQGRVASQALIKCIRKLTSAILARPDHLRQWLFDADDAVAAEIARHTNRPGASTFIAALPNWGWRRWQITWVGDCRAYKIGLRGEPWLLTCDDTYGHLNEPPPSNAEDNDPARMVGNGAVDEANRVLTFLHSGQILLLCSDGVHKMVPDEQMMEIMRGSESLNTRCRKLVTTAHTNGGTDDATVVAVQRHRWFGLGDKLWVLATGILLATSSLLILNHTPPETLKIIQAPTPTPTPTNLTKSLKSPLRSDAYAYAYPLSPNLFKLINQDIDSDFKCLIPLNSDIRFTLKNQISGFLFVNNSHFLLESNHSQSKPSSNQHTQCSTLFKERVPLSTVCWFPICTQLYQEQSSRPIKRRAKSKETSKIENYFSIIFWIPDYF